MPDHTEQPTRMQGRRPPPEPPVMVRAIVAPRRSVCLPTPDPVFAGYDDTGKAVMRSDLITYGPNQEVELPAAEVVRLRGLGFLIDPKAWQPQLPEVGVGAYAVPQEETERLRALALKQHAVVHLSGER